MGIDIIVRSVEYLMDQQFQNCQFSEPNFDFPNWKNIRNFFIFQFVQYQKLRICKIQVNFNSGNSQNLQFGKLEKKIILEISKKFSILKIPKISQILQL